MKLLVTLERDESGMMVAECPAIPGCVSKGQSESEALEDIREAIAGCLEGFSRFRIENGQAVMGKPNWKAHPNPANNEQIYGFALP